MTMKRTTYIVLGYIAAVFLITIVFEIAVINMMFTDEPATKEQTDDSMVSDIVAGYNDAIGDNSSDDTVADSVEIVISE